MLSVPRANRTVRFWGLIILHLLDELPMRGFLNAACSSFVCLGLGIGANPTGLSHPEKTGVPTVAPGTEPAAASTATAVSGRTHREGCPAGRSVLGMGSQQVTSCRITSRQPAETTTRQRGCRTHSSDGALQENAMPERGAARRRTLDDAHMAAGAVGNYWHFVPLHPL